MVAIYRLEGEHSSISRPVGPRDDRSDSRSARQLYLLKSPAAAGPMTALLALALLAAPQVEAGIDVGPGLVADRVVLTATPWVGGRRGPLSVAIQGPLRLDFDTFKVRRRDWDEREDLGRVLRFLRYGEIFQIGALPSLTLGNGTLMRRYHNGLDDDHNRMGVRISPDLPFEFEAFADRVLGPPVAGGRAGWSTDGGSVVGTVVADFDALTQSDGTADAAGWLRGERGTELGMTLGATWSPGPGSRLYVEGARLSGDAYGGHLGVSIQRESGLWRTMARVEGIAHGAGYVGGQFDTGYLIDREALAYRQRRSLPAALGGRLGLELSYARALQFGVDYSDDRGGRRAALDAWISAPFDGFDVGGFWRQRYRGREGLLDPEGALAALVIGLNPADGWRLEMTGARTRRIAVDADGGAKQAQFTEYMLRLSFQSQR